MGFGFNLLLVFILFPLTVFLAIIWLVTKKKLLGRLLAFVWIPVVGIILLVRIFRFITGKKELDHDDIYGDYIDRTRFPGKQAGWQYDHFRFEITKRNTFLFHLIDKNKILKTYTGLCLFLKLIDDPELL